jgi:NAD(P)H-hydrate repair Nnr-like enzyme with NAD(P)H-hydrate dehydratase domain
MSRFSCGEEWMKSFLTSHTNPLVVIHADSLFLLRNVLDMVWQYKGHVIFTPHPGKRSRFVNKTVNEEEANRQEIATTIAKDYSVYLLLKGNRSIIATTDGEVYINPHGNVALGKGGNGDILIGLNTSFLAQGAPPLNALIAASSLHARAEKKRQKLFLVME